jgi:hypothetical protein
MRTPKNHGPSSPLDTSVSNPKTHSSLRPKIHNTHRSHFSLFRRMLLPTLMALIAITLTQCSDKEDDPDPTETPTGIVLSGIVQAPAGTTAKTETSGPAKTGASGPAQTAKATTSAGETPLPNTKVDLYRLGDYFSNPATAQPLATVTTGADGRFTAEGIPANTDILAITQSDPRLSAIYMNASAQTNIDINTATTLTAEFLAPDLLGGQTITNQQLQSVLQRAAEITEALSGNELLALLNGLLPNEFGQGLAENPPPQFQQILNQLSGVQQTDCSAITFSASSGKPGTVILVDELPDEFGEEPYLWFYDAAKSGRGKADRFPALIERTGPGQASLVLPVYPGDPMVGGTIEMVLESEDETLTCNPVTFTIHALDPAPGATAATFDKFEEALEHLVEVMGFDPAEFSEQPGADDHPMVQTLTAAMNILGGENNPDNVRAMLAGESTYFESDYFSDSNLELMDAVLNTIGFLDQLNELFDAMMLFDIPADEEKSTARGNNRTIRHPVDLHNDMVLQSYWQELLTGYVGLIIDISGVMIGTVGALVLPTAPLATVAGISLTMITIMAEMAAGSLPSQLLGFEMEASPEVYKEDETTTGEWSASLVARSRGYKINLPTIMGAIPGFGRIAKGVGLLARKNPVLSEGLEQATGFMYERTRDLFARVEEGGAGEDPKEFSVKIVPMRQAEKQTIEIRLITRQTELGGDPFVLTSDMEGYNPIEVGVSELRIQTISGKFAGQSALNNRMLEIPPIIVKVEPQTLYLPLGETGIFQVAVENAIDEEVEWRIHSGGGGLAISPLGEDQLEVEALEAGEYTLIAESMAETGPRSDRHPPRQARVLVVVSDLIVNSPSCLTPGEAFQFTARIGSEEISFSELEYVIDGPGNISGSGQYVSSSTGEVTINFRLKENHEITAEVNFEVREKCPNQYVVSISGGPLMGVYEGEIEHDDDDYMLIPSHINLETEFGLTGKTSASLNMPAPNIWVMMTINMDHGVPRLIGTEGGDDPDSFVQLIVADRLMVGTQGHITLSNYKTYTDFLGNESSWSGTVEFSGLFGMADDEDGPLFLASGRIIVMPFPAEDD